MFSYHNPDSDIFRFHSISTIVAHDIKGNVKNISMPVVVYYKRENTSFLWLGMTRQDIPCRMTPFFAFWWF